MGEGTAIVQPPTWLKCSLAIKQFRRLLMVRSLHASRNYKVMNGTASHIVTVYDLFSIFYSFEAHLSALPLKRLAVAAYFVITATIQSFWFIPSTLICVWSSTSSTSNSDVVGDVTQHTSNFNLPKRKEMWLKWRQWTMRRALVTGQMSPVAVR